MYRTLQIETSSRTCLILYDIRFCIVVHFSFIPFLFVVVYFLNETWQKNMNVVKLALACRRFSKREIRFLSNSAKTVGIPG